MHSDSLFAPIRVAASRTRLSQLRDRFREDSAAVLPLVAVMMIVLLGMAAFATDLGWFYVNATRIQRAAEAAALSGVVELPDNIAGSSAIATGIAGDNGYTNGPTTTVTPNPQPNGALTQLEVTITDQVDTFFLTLFGMDTQAITRSATAEYVPPLPLGSDTNLFGNDPVSGIFPNFWANIHGRHTDVRMGDAFSSYCADGAGSGNSGCAMNLTHRETGYTFGIEAAGGIVHIRALDGMFRNESGGNPNDNGIRTGDHNDFCGAGPVACAGPTTAFKVYAPDATPLDLTDNGPPICTQTFGPEAQVPAAQPWVGSDWQPVCSISTSAGLIYPMQVTVDGFGGETDDGLNRFSIKVTPGSRIFGIGDMSIFNNFTGTTDFFLAEVADFYRGKTFVVELYDPGDAGGGGTVQIKDPAGATYGSCEMFSRGEVNQPWTSLGTRAPCEFLAQNNGGANDYNGDWVKVEMELPDTYSCANCWWKVNYLFPGAVSDTTTWRAYVIGAPVHLVP
ncbi:MAG: pilus assembly protein TadG-related protein [Acidimicrobiia bacterium]|nr:pilus assembly protein TadG-related protein [Acidimicrobiia bacterium]